GRTPRWTSAGGRRAERPAGRLSCIVARARRLALGADRRAVERLELLLRQGGVPRLLDVAEGYGLAGRLRVTGRVGLQFSLRRGGLQGDVRLDLVVDRCRIGLCEREPLWL